MDRPPPRLPVFLNLAQIRFPIGAIASIAHRVAGVLLLIALPVVALMLDACAVEAPPFTPPQQRLPVAIWQIEVDVAADKEKLEFKVMSNNATKAS